MFCQDKMNKAICC